MGLLDEVSKAFAGPAGGTAAGGGQGAVAQALMGLLGSGGGLEGLVQSFEQKGLGDLVGSWISTGPNLPVTAAQVSNGLGPELLAELASKTGLNPNEVAGHLSQLLPGMVDKLTPQGSLPAAGSLGGILESALSGFFT
jgi:uncharacterized protein YidB (DUF937 family)